MSSKIKLDSLAQGDRLPYFLKAADISGKPAHILEKDFWVCWTLGRLFEIESIKDYLTFKGGTSLSKVYSVIERFSEDIDISIERSFLGFVGEKDPEKTVGKKRNETLKELSDACSYYVKNDLITLLTQKIENSKILGNWKLEIDPDDPDEQTLLFHYPKSVAQEAGYVAAIVKIEIGARSDHWPVSQNIISSYVKQILNDVILEERIEIKVLNIQRTFWEKATILHMYAHFPVDKNVPERQSRHYYDFYQLLRSSYKESSISDIELLKRVAEHKSIYFRAEWASYHAAQKGTLKLIPNEIVLQALQKDYKRMSIMFFGEFPSWDDIIKELIQFECDFNR